AVQSVFEITTEANVAAVGGEFRRQQGARAAEADLGAQAGEQEQIGAGHAAVEHVANDGDAQAGNAAAVAADGEGIEQCLGGVLVHAIAGVDDGDIDVGGDKVGGAAGAVADNDAVDGHGAEGVDGIEEGFALFDTAGTGVDGDGFGAQAAGGDFKRGTGTGGGLVEQQQEAFAGQRPGRGLALKLGGAVED